ncbi:MAG: formate dehydrogenase subunit gamma [Proteobacteria bacterium]|nr:formate dehydrogenase subunit gamma [Pseudomonadota bacterium]
MTQPLPPLEGEPRTQAIDGLIARYRDMPGATLPMLHALQDAFGHVPPAAVPRIAQALNLSRAEVHGVLGFYHHLRTQPPPRRLVQLCRAEACQSMGADDLWAHACASLGLDAARPGGATTADGGLGLLPVYCLGLCACAPAMMVDGQPHGRVQAADFDRILSQGGQGL